VEKLFILLSEMTVELTPAFRKAAAKLRVCAHGNDTEPSSQQRSPQARGKELLGKHGPNNHKDEGRKARQECGSAQASQKLGFIDPYHHSRLNL
jgi:hypothetical protein